MGISFWHRGCSRCSSASIRRLFRGWRRLPRRPSHLAVFRGGDLEETHDPLGIATDLDLPPIPSPPQFRARPPVDEPPEAGIPEPPESVVPGSSCVDRCHCEGGGVVLRMADVAGGEQQSRGGEQAARVMLDGLMANMRLRCWRTMRRMQAKLIHAQLIRRKAWVFWQFSPLPRLFFMGSSECDWEVRSLDRRIGAHTDPHSAYGASARARGARSGPTILRERTNPIWNLVSGDGGTGRTRRAGARRSQGSDHKTQESSFPDQDV
jgi:hypothetical protein